MKFGLHLYTYVREMTDATWDILPRIKSLGYDGCEVPLMPEELDHFDYSLALAKLEEAGMSAVGSTGMTPDMCIASDDAGVRMRGMAHMKHAIDCTAALGATVISGALYAAFGWRPSNGRTQQQWTQSARSLKELARYAADRNVTLTLESLNRYEHYFINIVDDTLKMIADVGEPNVKIHMDTYHMNIEERNFYQAVKKAGNLLGHVHCAENDRGIPGTGHIDWNGFFKGLAEVHYDEWIVVESFFEPIPSIVDFSPIWRRLAPDADTLGREALRFIKAGLAPYAIQPAGVLQ